MAIGSRGAYATDRPVQDTIGDALKYTEQMGFKYREEAEKKKEKEDAIKKANEAIPELKAKTTPYSNRNAFIYDTLDKLKTGMAEKQRLASAGKISQQESNLFKQNAMQTIDLLNQSSERITAQNANMAKLISEGKVADGFEKDALALGGAIDKNQLHPEINPDGTLNVTVYDVDESGKKRVLDSGGLDKIGEVAYTPIRNVKFEDYLKTFRETHPIDFTEKFVGNTKVGTKELTPRLASSINDYTDALLADKDALAVAYKNATGNIKRDITDAKDIQIAKEYVADYIKDSYNKELNVDEAYQGAELRRKIAQDKKDEIKLKTFDFNNYRTDDFLEKDQDGKTVSPYTVYRKGISFSKPIDIVNLGGENSDLNMVKVLGVTKDKKTGDLIFTGKALKTKNAKFTVGGETFDFLTVSDLAVNGTDEQKAEAKAALASYNVANNYGNFIRRIESEDEANAVLAQANLDVSSADAKIEELNKGIKQFEGTRKPNTKKVYVGIDPKTGKAIYK